MLENSTYSGYLNQPLKGKSNFLMEKAAIEKNMDQILLNQFIWNNPTRFKESINARF